MEREETKRFLELLIERRKEETISALQTFEPHEESDPSDVIDLIEDSRILIDLAVKDCWLAKPAASKLTDKSLLQRIAASARREDVRAEAQARLTISEPVTKLLNFAETGAGGWPSELPRDTFARVDFAKLVARLKDYQEREYRGPSLGDASRPEYVVVDDKVSRRCDPVKDIQLVTTAHLLSGRIISPLDVEGIADTTYKVIKHYAEMRLPKFLFLLPTLNDHFAELSETGRPHVTPAELAINVYKGVENMLFEIYDELAEGETFNHDTVTRKLKSIVESTKAGT